MEMNKGFDPIKSGAVFSIDKPKGWSSFAVVDQLRKSLKKAYGVKKLKVGHAGTLDPMATGLLICCSGPMTKRIDQFQNAEKSYRATLRFGYRTASHDAETEVVSEHPTEGIDQERIETVLPSFEGRIQQVPPSYSAVRINGKRAYEEARKGKEPELGSRTVDIHEIELESFEGEEATIRIRCGKGTYIRSLARDLGEELGSAAYLKALRRTRIGEYDVDNALTIDELRASLQSEEKAVSDRDRRN
jgi:tRNA pseudouridine55 synthase